MLGQAELAALTTTPGGFEALGRVLDVLDTAACLLDAEETIRGWNQTYERFFPEHVGQQRPGLSYAKNLERFFLYNAVFAEFPPRMAADTA